MRIVLVFSILLMIAGCGNNVEKDTLLEDTEKETAEVSTDETVVIERTEEELHLIELFNKGYYKSILRETEAYIEDDEFKKDIHHIAKAFDTSNYSLSLAYLDDAKNVPEEIMEKVLKFKNEREAELNKEEQQRMVEKSTKSPSPVTIGMTKNEVLTKGWGKPTKINKTTTTSGTSEQWVYPNYKYLYFEDDILVTIEE